MKSGLLAILVAFAAMVLGAQNPLLGQDTEKPGDDGRCLEPSFPNSVPRNTMIVDNCSRVIESAKRRGRSPSELARFHYQRANALKNLGRLDDALADMNSAILTDPKYDPGYEGKGEVYLARKEFQKALDAFDDSHVQIQNVKVWGRARALEGLGRKREAIAEFKRLEQIDRSMNTTVNEALVWLGVRQPPPVTPHAPINPPRDQGGGCVGNHCAFSPI